MKKILASLWFGLLIWSFSYGQNMQDIARSTIYKTKDEHGLTTADLQNWLITDQYKSKKSGLTNIYIRQRHQGIELPDANINIHINEAGEVIHLRNEFISNLAKHVKSSKFGISAEQAITLAAAKHGLAPKKLTKTEDKNGNELTFVDESLSIDPIPAKKILHLVTKKDIRAAWAVTIYTLDAQHMWMVRVDASNGEILAERDGVIHCTFGDSRHVHCNDEEQAAAHALREGHAQFKKAQNPDSYNVFPLTIESPNHGTRMLVTDPADPIASPYGWHDTDGVPGAEYTTTRGNNVHAQDDVNGNNGNGYSPDGGPNLEFDFPYTTTMEPNQYQDASLTNLFFWSNIMHDVWYQYGFDEASGNFQQTNYEGIGEGGDYVLADGQDGSGTNNANFATPAEGQNPRMQMYLWTGGGGITSFEVNSPAGIAGLYGSSGASFGSQDYNVTGTLVAYDPNEACSAPTNGGAISGNIALIDRGTCEFGAKSLNAQNAGAIAVIICNNAAGGTITMGPGAQGGSVTIPAQMISQADCATIRAQTGVEITMTSSTNGPSQYDGSLDNGIVAHEYGHGISTRLTGGPYSSCLGNQEQMGEGWSDFFGLALTVLPNHTAETSRGIGTYAGGEPITGSGIRTYPYSRDMAVNPHTYDDIKSEAVPHGVGSVWCVMIWDMFWNLVDEYGYDTDLYYGTGGNNIAMHLVTEGLKLQGCDPGFVSGRDAILAADRALYGGANECFIWEAFARRGLGFSASQGSTNNRSDGTEAYDYPPEMYSTYITKTANVAELYEGQTVTYTLEVEPRCFDANGVATTDALPAGLTYVAGSASNGGSFAGNTVSFPTEASLLAGNSLTYTFDATVDVGAYYPPITLLSDDLSTGANWVPSGGNGTRVWTLANSADCSSNAYFCENFTVATELNLTTATAYPINGLATLEISHAYDYEGTWDGGVIEISIDNGSTWEDLGPYFTQNGYKYSIDQASGTSIAGRDAFTGSSNGCITSIISLCNYIGTNALFRFHAATDSNTGTDGWYINNVIITEEAAIRNEATTTSNGESYTDGICLKVVEAPPAILLSAKALLEGPYFAPLMNDALRTNSYIPIEEPFTGLGFTFVNSTGGDLIEGPATVFAVSGDNATVDWIFVELRDETDPTVVIATRAGLLQRDGDIVDVDGVSPLAFDGIPNGNYYVAIQHRNHLGIMTASAVSILAAGSTIDFTSDALATYGSNARKDVNGVMVMWAGDADANGRTDAADRSVTWNERNTTGYLTSDVNVDGQCNAADRSITWNNRNKTSQLP